MMKKVGIAGAGGIGSNVAYHLIRNGVTNLKIVDYDVVDQSNLNRQFYFKNQIGLPKVFELKKNLESVVDGLTIEALNLKLTEENIAKVFSDCDIVVEAFDKKETKAMLLNKFANKKYIVCANGIANRDIENVVTKKIGKKIFVVGDFESDTFYNKTSSIKVLYVATLMANIVLNFEE